MLLDIESSSEVGRAETNDGSASFPPATEEKAVEIQVAAAQEADATMQEQYYHGTPAVS